VGLARLTAVSRSDVREVLKTSGSVSLSIEVADASADRAEPTIGSGCTGSGGASVSASHDMFHISTARQNSGQHS
jgi:hypothetical protein